MFVSLRIITLPDPARPARERLIDALRAPVAELGTVKSSWLAPVVESGAINAGHLVWRMTFDTEADALAAPLDPVWRQQIAPLLLDAQITGVGYRITQGAGRQAGAGVWRALIFRVAPQGFPGAAKALEDGLLLFPKYITAIRSWALSPVAFVEGPKTYTHVWEQEFDTLEGLTVDYMEHPIHWGLVDAFFDAESPQYVVDPHPIQVICQIDRPVIARREDGHRP